LIIPIDIIVSADNENTIKSICETLQRSLNKSNFDQRKDIIKNYIFDDNYYSIFNATKINKIKFENCRFIKINFSWTNFTDVYFSNCEIIDDNFSNSIFNSTVFSNCDLSSSIFRGCNFSYSSIRKSEAKDTDFKNSKFNDYCIYDSNLCNSNFSKSVLIYTEFSHVDLTNTKFIETEFKSSKFNCVNLRNVDFSKSKGLLNPIVYLQENFEWININGKLELIVYKIFDNCDQSNMVLGSIIEEEVNYDRTLSDASGITVYNKEGVIDRLLKTPSNNVWKCRIFPEWFPGIVVPYDPIPGKIRVSRISLIEKIMVNKFLING
jgi:uncharacterized protein YjbI with pentapeptide repeats